MALRSRPALPPRWSGWTRLGETTRLRYPRAIRAGIGLGALGAAVILVVAEFLTLYTVHVPGSSAAVQSVRAGSDNSFALLPVAFLGVMLAASALGKGGRWALGALALVGLIGLLIGLLHDLPDARHTGLIGSARTGYHQGASSPSVGMYLETLGAVLLLIVAGLGLLFGEPSVPAKSSAGRRPASRPAT